VIVYTLLPVANSHHSLYDENFPAPMSGTINELGKNCAMTILNDLDLRQLEAFSAVISAGSVTAAAKRSIARSRRCRV